MVLDTIVYHVSEKTSPDFLIHTPSVNDVYQQILTANNDKVPNVVLLPEYNAHAVWADEAAWITANFQDIPVMVDCAGGWEHHVTVEEIAALIAAGIQVKWVRIAELVSYYEEWLHEEFPDDYVIGLLEFCRANNIKVYFCEWKISAFDKVLEVIEGFEDIVTVGFKTNSGDMEPAQGFKFLVDKLRAISPNPEHWGATIETWYWETRHRGLAAHPEADVFEPNNMPVSFMVCHMQEAVAMPNVWYSGAELLQFEAYWWFFENTTGKARESLKTIHRYLNSQVALAPNSTVILELLKAEWIGAPAKADIEWLDGRAAPLSPFDIQPSSFDFKNMTKKYAVSCYSLGEAGNRWMRMETISVEVLVKTLGTTLDKASFIREKMRVEVERIIFLYSRLGPLWDPGTGVMHRRVVPGLVDVSVVQMANKVDDSNFARVTVQVKCSYFPKKLWVSK
ncbi:MAG: hypothetical protein NWF01_07855 [Candidatus Bathyarchaeota archaeon]|nr:hypothetical protein [Candidatus Bathyarchaeota archaeon]